MAEKIDSEMTSICFRIERDVKERSEKIFSEIGLNMTTAINIFLRRCIMENGIPFEVGLKRPNAETMAAIEEVEAMRRGDIPKRKMSFEEIL
ncbi:MAG: type II toxin-antitoxin system RelB/DinJ family antitoxin [Methanomassiliicoccaceae archaeon]|nr:type II toxin-antitoxin system RelB/DinJ family antitoxin [Methanomassiliicoccaceae archaeon]